MPPGEQDIVRLHEKVERTTGENHKRIEDLRAEFNMHVNSINGCLSQMSTSVAVMAERFKQLENTVHNFPSPQPRPCDDFQRHQEAHEKIKYLWLKSIVSAVISSVAAAIGTLLLFFHGKGGPNQ